MKNNSSGSSFRQSPSAWSGWVLLLALLAFFPLPVSANCLSCSYQWLPQIQKAYNQSGVDPKLIQAVLAYESSGIQTAKSGVAYGLMQLKPGTFNENGGAGKDIFNPQANIDAGASYIAKAMAACPNNLGAAVAAYNYGIDRISKTYHCQVPPGAMGYVQGVLGNFQKLGGQYNGAIPLAAGNTPATQSGANGGKVPSANDITGLSLELSHFFEQLFSQLMQISQQIVGNLSSEGARLASILTVIAVIWAGLEAALKQDPLNKLMARMVEVLLICGIALTLVQSNFYQANIQQPIDNTFCAIAGRFSTAAMNQAAQTTQAGQTAPAASAGQAPQNCASMNGNVNRMTAGITSGIMNIWKSIIVEAHQINPFNDVRTFLVALWNFSGTLTLMTLWLLDALTKLVVIVILLFAMLTCFVVYSMSVILSSIGFALGPIFIPWMIFEITNEYTKGWAQFVLIAEMYKVMAVLIMSLGTPLINKILSYICAANGPGGTCTAAPTLTAINPQQPWAFGQLLLQTDIPLLIVAVLLAHFMKHAGEWAEGFIRGSAKTGLNVKFWF